MPKYKNYDERFTFEGGSGTQAPIIMYGKRVEDYPSPSGKDNSAVLLFFKDKNFTTVFDEQEVINLCLNGNKFLAVFDDYYEIGETETDFRIFYTELYSFGYMAMGAPGSKPEDLDFRLYPELDSSVMPLLAREEDIELVADISTENGEGRDSQSETAQGENGGK